MPSLFVATVLALAFAALGSLPASAASRHYLVEDQSLTDRVKFEVGSEVLAVTTVEPPRHGSYVQLAWPSFTYTPSPGYFGYDSVQIAIHFKKETLYAELEIVVLPARIPLTGRWDGDVYRWPALYDPARRRLQLCSGIGDPGGGGVFGVYFPLVCQWHGVTGAPVAAIPFLRAGEPGLPDTVGLFAPASGGLYRLDPADAGAFTAALERLIPQAVGRFPVPGVFNAGGPPAIAFASRSGEVGMLDANGLWTDWPQPLPVGGGDDLVWPVGGIVFGEADALALLRAGHGDLAFLTFSGQTGFSAALTTWTDLRRPFGASRTIKTERIPVLVGSPATGLYVIESFYGYSGSNNPSPQTYPLKFPDDPP